jgi:RND family efflux transporter MFP subunit
MMTMNKRFVLCIVVSSAFTLWCIVSCSQGSGKKSKLTQWFSSKSEKPETTSSTKVKSYGYFEVKRGNLVDDAAIEGRLEAGERSEVRATQRIRVQPARLKVNDSVKRGDVLFVVDTKELEQRRVQASERVAQLAIDIKNSRAQLEFARKQLERKKTLFTKGIVSRKELDEAEKQFVAAETDLQTKDLESRKADRELKTSTESVAGANIVAPFDGVVAMIAPGDTEIGQGQTLAVVANPKTLAIKIPVSEVVVTKFRQGQKVEVTVDAVSGVKLTGDVKEVETKSSGGRGSINTYSITVNIPQDLVKKFNLKDGYRAIVRAVFSEQKPSLLIPRSGIRRNGSETYLLVASTKGAPPEARAVKIGAVSELEAQVLSGVKENEFIAVPIDEEEPVR